MREILFRGKRIDNGEWVYGGYAVTENQVYLIYNQAHSIDLQGFTVDENTIGQYTGLTDKNGKKIFEGDIIKIIGILVDGEMVAVMYNSGLFGVKLKDHSIPSIIPLRAWNNSQIEVIGNIHDNPELLEGKP